MTGSGGGEDSSREEVSVLLVEVEAAERVERPFFRGGCLVVPGEWRSRLAEARESGEPAGVMEVSVGKFVGRSVGTAGSLADLATRVAQEVGGDMKETGGVRGEAWRK